MKNTTRHLPSLFLILGAVMLVGPAFAQVAMEETFEAATKGERLKSGGTYFSSGMQLPPLPYHPFPDLPTAKVGDRTFVYDDSKVDYKTLREEAAAQAAIAENSFTAAKNGPEGGSGPQCLESTGGLRLSLPTFIGTNKVQFDILSAEPGGIYDLFISTNLASTNAWTFAFRTAPGQTNFQTTLPAGSALTFMLGTTLDTDGDSLSDAFENLVSHTDAQTMDTVATAGTNAWLAELLTARAPEKRLAEVHWKHEQIVLNHPCDNSGASSQWLEINWTNGVGGMETITDHIGYCDLATHTSFYTNWDREIYWASNDSHCVRSRVNNGPWSTCSPDSDAQPWPPPRNVVWSYIKQNGVVIDTEQTPP